jgi:epsilon-lactone hydrolase
MDDAMAVWKEVIKLARPDNIAGFGSSAGSGTPQSDLRKTGDSYFTNHGVDGTHTCEGFLEATAKLCANGRGYKGLAAIASL